MLSLSDPAARPSVAERTGRRRFLGLYALWIAALSVGGALAWDHGPPAPMEPGLRHLLELMAVLKSATAVVAVLLTEWRLGTAARPAFTYGYPAAAALMAAGSAILWHLTHLLAAGALFHSGLLLFLGLAYADRDAPVAMLSSLQAKRALWRRGYL